MWMTKVSINNPVFAAMVMVGLCVLGLFAYQRLGVEQIPDISVPVLTIHVDYPGASPEAVENDITKPIENAVNTVNGIKKVRSNSWEGISETYVEFRLETDMARATQDVRDKIAQIRPTFPREAKDPLVGREDQENQQPVVSLAVTASSRNLRELTTLTEQVIVKQLQKAAGVGRVATSGGATRQVLIKINPAKLAANGIGVDQVMEAIRSANQDLPTGLISNAKSEAVVRVEGKMKNVADFGRIIVARRNNIAAAAIGLSLSTVGTDVPVYLSEVADVEDGEREAQSISRLNGAPAIAINVFKVQDANLVEVGHSVKASLDDLKKQMPPGVEIKLLNANSDWVEQSLNGVKRTILEGGLLTVMIVFLFLRSWRSTIITGLTLPISVISTFIALYAFGFTLNFMTMMALSLCIGLLIDDAIVVRENIVRHLHMGKDHKRAAEDGTNEIGLAVMATTFAIVAVFVPVAFMKGVIGRFFFSFGMTVTVAVLISLIVSFTLDPMLSSVWYDPTRSRIFRVTPIRLLLDGVEHVLDKVHVIYGHILDWALRRRLIVLALAVAIFIGSLMIVPYVGTEFMPDVDQSWSSLKLTTPVGSSLDFADQKARQVEAILKDYPEIDAISVNVFGEGRNVIRVELKLKPRAERERSQKQLEKVFRDRLARVPGIQTSVGWDTPIFVSVLGPDDTKLAELANHLTGQIGKIKGIVDLTNSLKPGTPALIIRPRANLASDLGLTTARIGNALRPLVAGETASYWLASDGQNYEVNVQLPKTSRELANDIGELMISTTRTMSDGTPMLVPLRQVADIVQSASPQVIKRQDLQRRVGIYANVEGRPSGDAGKEVQTLVDATVLPPGYRFDVGGQTEQMQDSFSAALGALGLAVIFIYLILASQFGSFLQPLAIMASLPFSLIGVLLALLVTGTTLNIFSLIGFIMLMGLVTKNAILLVDFANHGQANGLGQHDALLQAGQVRLRPILMTTVAMIFGMLPLALGLSEGSEQQSPMGRAIIGGVITSTLLTLVVVPVIYSYLDAWGRKLQIRHATRVAARMVRENPGMRTPLGGGIHGGGAGQPAAPLDEKQ